MHEIYVGSLKHSQQKCLSVTYALLCCISPSLQRNTLLHRSCGRQWSVCMEMGCLVMVGQPT